MKKFQFSLLLLSLLFSLLNCKSNDRVNHVSEEELIKMELHKGIRRDTVFLNYVFGMDYLEVQDHKSKLTSSGILFGKVESFQPFISKDGSYLSFGKYDKVFVSHFCNYYKWKLSKVTAIIDAVDLVEMTSELSKFYTDKYGNPSIVTPITENEMLNVYTWIEGNRKISIEPNAASKELLIIYEDVSLYFVMKNEKKQKNDSLKVKTKDII